MAEVLLACCCVEPPLPCDCVDQDATVARIRWFVSSRREIDQVILDCDTPCLRDRRRVEQIRDTKYYEGNAFAICDGGMSYPSETSAEYPCSVTASAVRSDIDITTSVQSLCSSFTYGCVPCPEDGPRFRYEQETQITSGASQGEFTDNAVVSASTSLILGTQLNPPQHLTDYLSAVLGEPWSPDPDKYYRRVDCDVNYNYQGTFDFSTSRYQCGELVNDSSGSAPFFIFFDDLGLQVWTEQDECDGSNLGTVIAQFAVGSVFGGGQSFTPLPSDIAQDFGGTPERDCPEYIDPTFGESGPCYVPASTIDALPGIDRQIYQGGIIEFEVTGQP